jgi:phosphoadenosine phosphosulfate reductase
MRGLEATERAPDLERADAEQVLAHMLERHHPQLALACSFQKEDAVLIDMLLALDPSARVFTIDTGVLFPETYEAWRALEDRYGVRIEVFDALSEDGVPWTAAGCCTDRKVAAFEAALEGLDGWISGVRREQSPTRSDAPKLAFDARRGIWKANPLADWSAERVWTYIARHDVPYNELHDRGYESIGCAPCTLPGAGREGRWAGSERTECGLHV